MTQDPKNKKLIINSEQLEKRVALLNRNRLEEYHIERNTDEQLVGSVYLGRIVNLEPSLQAAFVDIGYEKNAFLHYWDMLPASYDLIKGQDKAHGQPRGKSGRFEKYLHEFRNKIDSKQGKKIQIEDIPKLFPAGSEILVQVTKGPIGTKGPRVSTNITIPGRYLVLIPFADNIGLSGKISDSTERRRIRKILSSLDIPEGMGCICRTVGIGRKAVHFKRDLEFLLGLWEQVEDPGKKVKPPYLFYKEPDIIGRTLRDFMTEDIDEILVDNKDDFDFLRKQLSKTSDRKMSSRVKHYRKAEPIFDYFNVEEQIIGIFSREIQLPGGGYICIDETEALISIDVNTGKMRGKDQAGTILDLNLKACDEIARQLRLRNIGGLVVIDFIDMRPSSHRKQVLSKMRKLVKEDSAHTKVLPISSLGLMEMTRQRENESLRDTIHDLCPYCDGRGRIKSPTTMSVEIQRRLRETLKRYSRNRDLQVRVIIHPTILARLKNEDAQLFDDLERKYGKSLSFRGDGMLHLEEFKLIDPETGEEY